MFPILLELGPLKLYSYGFLVAMGLLAGMTAIDQEAKRYNWNRDQMSKIVLMTFVMGLVGGRITYVITVLGKEDPWKALIDPHAGFVFYGGLIASWSYIYWKAKKLKYNLWDVLDSFALGICIGEGIGRFGCLLGGCCYGSHCDLPWAISLVTEPNIGKVHPVQAYEGIILFVLFALLWKRRLFKKYSGETVVAFVGAYAIIRFIIEFFRGDLIRGYVIDGVLTTSQTIGIFTFSFAIYLHLKLSKITKIESKPKNKRST